MKNEYLKELGKALGKHSPKETILLSPSRAEGKRMLSGVAAQGYVLVGVRAETPFSLAKELCSAQLNMPDAPKLIEEIEGAELVRKSMDKASGLYSGINAKSLSATRAIFRTFQEMALAGLPEDLSSHPAVIQSPKLQELQELRREYINDKRALNLIDRADLFSMALEAASQENQRLRRARYVALGDYAPAFLERQLLDKLSEHGGMEIVSLPCAQYMEPKTETEPEKPFLPKGAMAEHISDRIDATDVLKNSNARFVGCRGTETEVCFPFRDILEKELPLEDCAIVYLSGSYAQSLYEEACRFSLPVTMGGGLPLMGSLLYTTLKQVLELPLSDFYAERVCDLLTSGGLTPDQRGRLAERLRRKKVGWGKERYALAARYEEKPCPKDTDEEEWADKQGKEKALMEHWQRFLELLVAVAAPEKPLDRQLEDLGSFLKFCNHHSPREAAAYAKASELIGRITALEEGESALSRLLVLMESANYLSGKAEFGKLYIAPLSQAFCTGRKHLYILGFSRYAMQGKFRESPILLDSEREALGRLKTTIQQGREQEFKLLQLIIRHEGNFVMSYPDFDSAGMLSQDPAPFFRDAAGNSIERITYIPENSLLATDDFINCSSIELSSSAPDTAGCTPAELLPYKTAKETMENMPFSATMLEEAARCPYAFYLRRLLKIRSPQPVKRNEEKWLSPAEIGTFCHAVLEEYYAHPAARPWQDIFEAKFPELYDLVPMPRAGMDMEAKEQLFTILEKAVNWADSPENTPGYGKNVLATEEWFENLPMTFTTDWTLNKMQGSIDRVDLLPGGETAILDYKTGDPEKHKEEQHKHWQHYIYSVAEEQLHPDRKVSRAGYLFLQEEAEHLEIIEDAAQRQEIAMRIGWVLSQAASEKLMPECLPVYELYKNNKPPKGKPLGAMKNTSNSIHRSQCRNWCEFASVCPKQKGVSYDD